MDIVYGSDDRFAWIMGVSMLSLMENNREADGIHFHILDGGIEEENRRKILLLTEKYRRTCTFYPAKEPVERAMRGQKTPRKSTSTFSRLFVGQLLPQDLTRVLYLDCDTLVVDSLAEFWRMPFEGNIVAAVNDCCSNMHRRWIYLKKDQPYLQAGVLLIDLKAWRNFGIEDKVKAAIRKLRGVGPYGDQCLLGLILSERTRLVHPRYNCLISRCVFSYEELIKWRHPSFFYSEREVKESVAQPAIIHFATFFHAPRPWIRSSSSEGFYGKWKACQQASPWADHPLWRDDRPWWFRQTVAVYHFLPAKVAIPAAGLIHAFLMPAVGIWKMRLSR